MKRKKEIMKVFKLLNLETESKRGKMLFKNIVKDVSKEKETKEISTESVTKESRGD